MITKKLEMSKIKYQIFGNGFIANEFKRYSKSIKKKNLTIYAAGISRSSEKNNKNLKKEINIFKNFCKLNFNKIVYISSYSINDSSRINNKYVRNKIIIENIIRKNFEDFLIIRLPEIVGKNKNPYTLTNFFYNKIIKNKSFYLFNNVRRNLVDVKDAIKNCIKIINKKKYNRTTINLLNKKFYSPQEIVSTFEKILKIKANYKIKSIKKQKWKNKKNINLKFNEKYLEKILKKYYL